jgi:hypothetical protein
MSRLRRWAPKVCALALVAVVAVGISSLFQNRAYAFGPLCGYSLIWDCTMPDGSHRLVGGTVCDIQRFQQQTGAKCVPSGL